MPDGKKRDYGHDPIPARVERGLQPVRPRPDGEVPGIETIPPSGLGPGTAGLQPIPPARLTNQGDPGSDGGKKSS